MKFSLSGIYMNMKKGEINFSNGLHGNERELTMKIHKGIVKAGKTIFALLISAGFAFEANAQGANNVFIVSPNRINEGQILPAMVGFDPALSAFGQVSFNVDAGGANIAATGVGFGLTGNTELTILEAFEGIDGGEGGTDVTVTPVLSGYTGNAHTIKVMNVPPVIDVDTNGIYYAGKDSAGNDVLWSSGDTIIFRWRVTDVPADLEKATLEIYESGNPVALETFTGTAAAPLGNGIFNYVITGSERVVIEFRASDGDGGTSSKSFVIQVEKGSVILVNEVTYSNPINYNYKGLVSGLGDGSVLKNADVLSGVDTREATGNPDSWNVYFSRLNAYGQLNAVPSPVTVPDEDGNDVIYQSYFYVWVDGAEYITATESEIPVADDVVFVNFENGYATVRAVFSREYLPGDGFGDIDNDGLPDEYEIEHWGATAAEGFKILAEDPSNKYANPDMDFLPATCNATADGGAAFDYPGSGKNYAPGPVGFANFYELRGANGIINEENEADDDDPIGNNGSAIFAGTDPTVEDTDGDGLPDGWEYYFWINARKGRTAGCMAYDGKNIVTSEILIDSEDIIKAFDPLLAGDANADTDKDGLSNYEEFILGTDPINWDSDGDQMADGWEVMYGLDPFAKDGAGNPDRDYMAVYDMTAARGLPIDVEIFTPDMRNDAGPYIFEGEIHFDIYADARFGWDPKTAWTDYAIGRDRKAKILAPNTWYFWSIDEYYVMKYHLRRLEVLDGDGNPVDEITPSMWSTYSSDPLTCDTDGDNMPDGWELYLNLGEGLNSAADDLEPLTGDGLINVMEYCGMDSTPLAGVIFPKTNAVLSVMVGTVPYSAEFSYRDRKSLTTTNMVNVNATGWRNKFWPSLPIGSAGWDTDSDGIFDVQEQALFNSPSFSGYPDMKYVRGSWPQGGLNPCTVDTDYDGLPDIWESMYADGHVPGVRGMDGTVFDSRSGLLSELTGNVENFDFDNDGLDNWQEYLVGAMCHFHYASWERGRGPGGYGIGTFLSQAPQAWDWNAIYDYWEVGIPPVNPYYYYSGASADPSLWDSDGDGMDDYYEMYHFLNPLLGGTPSSPNNLLAGSDGALPSYTGDFRGQPWTVGYYTSDPDFDGLSNAEEAIDPSHPAPYNHHTSPSPFWVSDLSYPENWASLYYSGTPTYWVTNSASSPDYPYPATAAFGPPGFAFSFASEEGYDTDGDNISDHQEIVDSETAGYSDPLNFDDPVKRKALYLDGASAARSQYLTSPMFTYRSWSVEAWVRPQQPVSPTGKRQIIIERSLEREIGNTLPITDYYGRTFRLGLEPDGTPFAEYNGEGGNTLCSPPLSVSHVLETNRWVHVAAVLDGVDKKLYLYINGEMACYKSTAEIPIGTGNPYMAEGQIIERSGFITIGAGYGTPDGYVSSVGQDAAKGVSLLYNFFKGWVDEVRVWEGVRSQDEVRSTMNKRFRYRDVINILTNYYGSSGALYEAAIEGGMDPSNFIYSLAEQLPPVLNHHVTFDNLPDPAYETIVPDGFDLINGRPDDGSYPGVPWWRAMQDRSRVYTDYLYVQFIEDTLSHIPGEVIRADNGNATNYNLSIVRDSPYWQKGIGPEEYMIPNTMRNARYEFYAAGESAGCTSHSSSDFLPLWYARADMSVNMWDNDTPGTDSYDSDGDGLSDKWEKEYGFDEQDKYSCDRYRKTQAGLIEGTDYTEADLVSDGDFDSDGDGLSNTWESLLGSNPGAVKSLDSSGRLTDYEWDSDGDGLSNGREISEFHTDPRLPDTDDDGFDDYIETNYAGGNPADPLFPAKERMLVLDGAEGSYLEYPETLYKGQIATNFDISADVYMRDAPATGKVAQVITRQTGEDSWNYMLGVNDRMIPFVKFTKFEGLGQQVVLTAPDAFEMPLDGWVNLRAVLTGTAVELYVDNVRVAFKDYVGLPGVKSYGEKFTRIGVDLDGAIDNVTIKNDFDLIVASSFNDGTSDGIVTFDGTEYGTSMTSGSGIMHRGQVQNFAYPVADWSNNWVNAGTLTGGAQICGMLQRITLDDSSAPEETITYDFYTDQYLDTDSDGLYDWWEIANGLNPYKNDTDGDGILDGDEDDDRDGLSNRVEMLVGTDPLKMSTTGDGTLDGDLDFDNDGLTNYQESQLGTDPSRVDSDDDGLTDYEEAADPLNGWTLGNSAFSPARAGVLSVDGTGYLQLPLNSAFRMALDWTVEAWICPATTAEHGTIIRRAKNDSVNYELGLREGVPYVGFTGVYGGNVYPREIISAAGALPVAGQWYHIAGVYEHESRTLLLYVDGFLVQRETFAAAPGTFMVSGTAPARAGEGLSAKIDQLRIWNTALTGTEIAGKAFRTFENSTAAEKPVCEFRFDDFGTTAEDSINCNQDWLYDWAHAATNMNGAIMELAGPGPRAFANVFTDEDGDGMPDFWEAAVFVPEYAASNTRDSDWDGDGLCDLYEYYGRTNPKEARTWESIGDKTEDIGRDLDQDGLTNIQEQKYGTRPDISDTDDDGVSDYEEVTGYTKGGKNGIGISNPLLSTDPVIPRGLSLDGNSRVVVPAQNRHSLVDWTVAAWVNPRELSADGRSVVVSRMYSDGHANYEIGVTNDGTSIRPYASYTTSSGTKDTLISGDEGTTVVNGMYVDPLIADAGTWTHIAATFQTDAVFMNDAFHTNAINSILTQTTNNLFSLYVNGELAAVRTDCHDVYTPVNALNGPVLIGGGRVNDDGNVTSGFNGSIDDVRISAYAADADGIRRMMGRRPIVGVAEAEDTNTSAVVSTTVQARQAAQPEFVKDELLVTYATFPKMAELKASLPKLGVSLEREYKLIPLQKVKIAAGEDIEAKMAELKLQPGVRAVEYNYIRKPDVVPNDPEYGKLWGMEKIGAPEAWDISTGNSDVVVAVIDTGLDYNHPDLADNVWKNPDEIADNGIDDDDNGYIDDIYGWDFEADDSDPMDNDGAPHGTHCSGTIGGTGNNGIGVAGVNWKVKIMALRFIGDFGGSDADWIAALEYAVDKGVRVSNNSYGGTGYSAAGETAIKAARDANHLFCAAAGNEGTDNDQVPKYPASFDIDNIISVAATDSGDNITSFSCYGANSVDIGAPGAGICSTVKGGGYESWDGTSMATPHVAGASALLLSVDPTLSYAAIRDALFAAADPLESLNGKCTTGARLNLAKAMPAPGPGEPGAPVSIRTLVGWYKFDDAGNTVEDFSLANGWKSDWRYAGIYTGNATSNYEAAYLDGADTDGDLLPDWWEEAHGFDPLSTKSDGENVDGETDFDGDGLTTFFEYLASRGLYARGLRGLNPFVADSDGNGVNDGLEDSDQDGISNECEQNPYPLKDSDVVGEYPTDPGNSDTDDDGITDGEELTNGTNPGSSSSPNNATAITFAGGNYNDNTVVVSDKIDGEYTSRYSSDEWTVELWVNPTAASSLSGTVPLVSRRLASTGAANYEVGLEDGMPYVLFDADNGAGSVKVVCPQYMNPVGENYSGNAVGSWTHIAGRFEIDEAGVNTLSLFVNGNKVASSAPGTRWHSSIGPGDLVLGSAGFIGQMSNVRIWKIPVDEAQITGTTDSDLLGGAVSEMGGYLQLTSGGHLKETAVTLKDSNKEETVDQLTEDWTLECWVRTTGNSGKLIARRNVSETTEEDFNYCLAINDNGALIGRFNMEYGVYIVPDEDLSWESGYQPDRNNTTGEIPVNDGRWHHVAYIRSAAGCFLYVDGILDTSAPRILDPEVENMYPDPANFWGVKSETGPCVFGEGFIGSLDEIRIWNRALTVGELKNVMNKNLSGSENGLVTYFNFDYQHDEKLVDEQSALRNPSEEYGVLIPYAAVAKGTSDGIDSENASFVYDSLLAIRGVSLVGLFLGNDDSAIAGKDGKYVEDFTYPIGNNPFIGYKYAGIPGANVSFAQQQPLLWLEGMDTDLIPDSWEQKYGLDIYSSSGNNGPWGDPDGDGLDNLAEYLISSRHGITMNPLHKDTDDDGTSDYYEVVNGTLTAGELYDDQDGMPSLWEVAYGLNPRRYDGNEDPDEDGWNNFDECFGGSDPFNPNSYPSATPSLTFLYSGSRVNGTLMAYFYSAKTAGAKMDGNPDAIYANSSAAATPYSETVSVVNGGGRLTYSGIVAGTVVFTSRNRGVTYQDDGSGKLISSDENGNEGTIDYNTGLYSIPISGSYTAEYSYLLIVFPYEASKLDLLSGHLRSGANRVFGFLDVDENGQFNVGEPAGMAEYQPFNVGYGNNEVTIPLTDELTGYPRFSWPAVEGASKYYVYVGTGDESEQLAYLTIDAPRNFVMEQDFYGVRGLSLGTSEWMTYLWEVSTIEGDTSANVATGIVTNDIYAGTAKHRNIEITCPHNSGNTPEVVSDSAFELKWKMDYRNQGVNIRIVGNNVDTTVRCDFPVRHGAVTDEEYYYSIKPQLLGGKFLALSNGTYTVTVSEHTNTGNTDIIGDPDSVTFVLRSPVLANDCVLGARYSISGTTRYFGRAGISGVPVRVQAFLKSGAANSWFNGLPAAAVSRTGIGSFALAGLKAGTYIIKAFVDFDRDGVQDPWETAGYLKSVTVGANGEFQPQTVSAASTLPVNSGLVIILSDRDTDHDRISDGYEYGASVGPAMAPSNSQAAQEQDDSSFLSIIDGGDIVLGNLTFFDAYKYGYTAFDSTTMDADDDGLPVALEKVIGTDPNLADTDGDGFSDADEYLAGTDPLDSSDGALYSAPGICVENGAVSMKIVPPADLIKGVTVNFSLDYKANITDPAWTEGVATATYAKYATARSVSSGSEVSDGAITLRHQTPAGSKSGSDELPASGFYRIGITVDYNP